MHRTTTTEDHHSKAHWFSLHHGRPSLEGPLVLPADLILLLLGEVVLDVERLADLLRSLALDHVSYRLAGQVQQSLDVQIVGSLKR